MRVGIANVNLNPAGPVTIDGFGARDRPSEGVEHDIEGQCVVFDNGAPRLGLMALDLLAVDDYLLVPIRQAARKLGIAPEQMMVNASHTHAAPNVTPCRSFTDTIWPWVQPLGFSVDSERILLEHVVQMVKSL